MRERAEEPCELRIDSGRVEEARQQDLDASHFAAGAARGADDDSA